MSELDLPFVLDLARSAGRLVMERYGKVARLTKRHDEAVTDADRASQCHIVEGLRRRFPDDGVIGEESDSGQAITFELPRAGGASGRVWVIDPIDGTNNFVAGFGNFAVCIGLLERGEPVLGVILDPVRDWMYAAARGQGATRNGAAMRVVDTPLGSHSVVMMTSNVLRPDGRPPQWALRWIGQSIWKLRVLGTAALDTMMVASGVAHGAVTVNGKLWDIAAGAAILREAGATLTDLAGRPIFPFNLADYDGAKVPWLAAAPQAHEALLREIVWHP